MPDSVFVAIDLKSFYASVECRERGLDPLTTHLVVADSSRTDKTICLAVTPSLKAYGVGGRARLFEVVQKVKEVNAMRLINAPGKTFSGSSRDDKEIRSNPSLKLDYHVAPPRMAKYMEYSNRIYSVYLKYIAPEDIHVYSIDEVFIDMTSYIKLYKLSAHELTMKIIQDVLKETGITATAGIGTNMYLAKVAMDIVAKHIAPDADGVRIAEIDEMSYREKLWDHRPLTDFWRVGKGYANKLEAHGLYTMGDIAKCSVGKKEDVYNEDLLYEMFGINAELLIDHAWGYEPCRIKDVKSYRPTTNSLSSGQVLTHPYTNDKAAIVVREMVEGLSLDLVEKGLITDHLELTIGYDIDNFKNAEIKRRYKGPVVMDHYGRAVPKYAHGTARLEIKSSSAKMMAEAIMKLFEEITIDYLLIRRLNIAACEVVSEKYAGEEHSGEQMDMFTDYAAIEEKRLIKQEELDKEHKMQQTMLDIKKKFGKNAILKASSLKDGATAIDRNKQIGGHKA